MASPFQYFRKRQKVMLAVFGVAIIFMFTVGPTALQFCTDRSIGQGNKDAVVTWTGGELTEDELYQLRIKNRLVTDYLIALLRTVAEKTQSPPDVNIAQVLPGLPSDGGDYAIFQLVFLSELAQKKGIGVTDEAVFAYLEQLTGGNLTRGEMRAVLASKEFKGRLTDDQLFDHLYKVVAAGEMQKIAQAGMMAIAPADALALAERDELKASVEFIPVRVEDFVDQLDDPTDEQIEDLFDKYKAIESVPSLPEPGFKKRFEAKFAYFEADYEKFVAEVKANLTDEEVKQYYEENKDFYVERDPIDPSDLDPDTGMPSDDTDETPEDGDGAATEAGDTDDTDATEDNTTSPEAGDSEPTDGVDAPDGDATEPTDGDATEPTDGDATEPTDGDATEPTDGDTTTDDVEDTTEPTEGADDTKATTDGEKDSADAAPETTEPGADESAAPTPTPDPTAGETDSDDTKETEAEAAVDETTDETPVADTATTDADEAADKTSTGSDETTADGEAKTHDTTGEDDAESGDDTEETSDETPAPEKKYKPLEEVEDEIREYLATRNAQQAMDEALTETQNDMNAYFKAYTRWEAIKDVEKDEVEPDFAPVKEAALKRGLTFGETELVDRYTVESEPIGEAQQRENLIRFDATGQQQRDTRTQSFADYAFANPVLRKPVLFPTSGFSQGQGGVFIQKVPGGKNKRQYIYWVTQESEEAVPELDDVRDAVVRAWKMMQALPLATEKAKEHAEEARESSSMTLEEIHGSTLEVVPVEEFTFFDALNDLPDVARSEMDFRKAVAALDTHEVGVIPNRAQTVVYVTRVQSTEPSDEAMRRKFMDRLKPTLGEPGTLPRLGFRVLQEGFRDSQNAMSQWFKQLSDDYEVKWERTPQAASQER